MVEWLVWMQSGIGPMQGQGAQRRVVRVRCLVADEKTTANHFYRYAPKKIDYAIQRYQTETKRLYQVLNDRLKSQEAAGQGLWIVGSKYTVRPTSPSIFQSKC